MTRLLGAAAVLAPATVLLLVGPPPAAASHAPRSGGAGPVPHTVAITLRGPVATVEVTRLLPVPRGGGEVLLDVALPERSALLDVEVGARGRWTRAKTTDATKARDSYLASLRARGLVAAAEPFDDATTVRFRVLPGVEVGRGEDATVALRYRFSTLLERSGGRFRLRMPGAPETTPVGADVTVTALAPPGATLADVDVAGVRTTAAHGARKLVATGQPSGRAGWEVSVALAGVGGPGAGPGTTARGPGLEVLAAAAPLAGRDAALALLVGASTAALPPGEKPAPLPERVLLLIDRSRSVGIAGLAVEHDLARRLLERLPPFTQFDVLFFDRGSSRLFASPRTATLEAIGALDDEMVPVRLANGSSLEGALRAAGDLLRREAPAFAPRALLAVLTDGAIPEDQTGATLRAALGPTPGLELSTAMLSIRPQGEEPPPATARKAMRALAEVHGGVEREIHPERLDDDVAGVLEALRTGGDLFSVRLDAGGDERLLAGSLPLAAGASGLLRVRGRLDAKAELRATRMGATLRTPLRPVPIEAAWLEPLLATDRGGRTGLTTRLAAASTAVALVEPVAREEVTPPPEPRGGMDRTVVRNTLSLAFMPRARACYQNRPMGTPALRELSGRVRLEIDLARGEVSGAGVQLSTLGNPTIEACLREAAFSIEVPRAYRSDAPVTAVVNLVFQPRSAAAQATPNQADKTGDKTGNKTAGEGPSVGEEIDLIMEQLPPELDVSDLLLTAPPPASPPEPAAPRTPAAPAKPALPAVPQKFE